MSVAPVVRERSPSEAIIEAVADREGVDPTDLDVPLFEAIDPEALDSLVRTAERGQTSLRIEFTYYGYEVAVATDGSVDLSRAG